MIKYDCAFFHPEFNGVYLDTVNLFGFFDGTSPVKVVTAPNWNKPRTNGLAAKIEFVEKLIDTESNIEFRVALHRFAADLTEQYAKESEY